MRNRTTELGTLTAPCSAPRGSWAGAQLDGTGEHVICFVFAAPLSRGMFPALDPVGVATITEGSVTSLRALPRYSTLPGAVWASQCCRATGPCQGEEPVCCPASLHRPDYPAPPDNQDIIA